VANNIRNENDPTRLPPEAALIEEARNMTDPANPVYPSTGLSSAKKWISFLALGKMRFRLAKSKSK
jgi:hypothetical protein